MRTYKELLEEALKDRDECVELGENWDVIAEVFYKLGQQAQDTRFFIIDYDSGGMFACSEEDAENAKDEDYYQPVMLSGGQLFVWESAAWNVLEHGDTEGMGL